MSAVGRRRGDRWLYWWNLGYRDGLTGAGRHRRVPSLYRHSYRYGLRQGMANTVAGRA